MKVSELLEAEDGDRTMTFNQAWTECKAILEDALDDLSQYKGEDDSYAIGRSTTGDLHAHVSGGVKLNKRFVEHSRYGSPRQWDLVLEVGNNLKNGGEKVNALAEVKSILADMKQELDVQGAKTEKMTGSSTGFFAKFGEQTITAKCEYARSFCWVGITKS